jgi:hypothetical protein
MSTKDFFKKKERGREEGLKEGKGRNDWVLTGKHKQRETMELNVLERLTAMMNI